MYYGEARGLYQRINNRLGEANVLRNLGLGECAMGDRDLGLQHLREALDIYRAIGDQVDETIVLRVLNALRSAAPFNKKALKRPRSP